MQQYVGVPITDDDAINAQVRSDSGGGGVGGLCAMNDRLSQPRHAMLENQAGGNDYDGDDDDDAAPPSRVRPGTLLDALVLSGAPFYSNALVADHSTASLVVHGGHDDGGTLNSQCVVRFRRTTGS